MRPVPPSNDIDFTLLDRFLAGECSPAEAESIRRWLAGREVDARYLAALRDALSPRPAASTVPDNPDALWARLARDTVHAERNAYRLPPPLRLTMGALSERRESNRMLPLPWLRIAAAVVLVAGAAAGVVRHHRAPTVAIAGIGTSTREYMTARGERAELRLPDGTHVILAPDSRLKVPAEFAATERTVALAGQAYFDVIHDDRKPFRVRAGNAVVHDLGTQFDVRAYPGPEPVRVTVAGGRVQVAAAAAAAAAAGTGPVLVRGDVGRLDATGRVTTGRADLATALAWTRGGPVLDDAPLSAVAVELARWYDLEVRIADPALRDKRLTLTLDADSAPEAVEAVALLAGARYEQHGRVVTFVPMPSPRGTGR